MSTGEDFTAIALSLPEAEERETWGEATFRVRDKIFAMMSPGGLEASVKASMEEQTALVASNPNVFAVAPYTGRFGWVQIQLAGVDAGHLRELLTEAWRRTAPKRMVAAFDAGGLP